MTFAIALGALFASVAPIYAMWVTLRQRSDTDLAVQQKARIEELEEKLERCSERKNELSDENVRLMRRLLANGNSTK